MFIELTDHLRCTEPHDEQFLVLLPGVLDGRRVVSGDLGCPVCGKVVRVEEGVVDFGGGTAAAGPTALPAEAIATFLGLSGPGGYVGLVGAAASAVEALAALLPGIRLILVNPAIGALDSAAASVLRAGRLPLKSGSMRGVVVGEDLATSSQWVEDSARAVLSGLRIVVAGAASVPVGGTEVLAESDGCWVGRRR
jgi:hypothetical protein